MSYAVFFNNVFRNADPDANGAESCAFLFDDILPDWADVGES